MSKIKKIIISVLVIAILVFAKNYYDMYINHNFETIADGKVYKSGVLPPDDIDDYVKKYKIKSIVDLRFPGTADLINNPESSAELRAEKEASEKIVGLNYFNLGSDQVPQQHNLDAFFKVMDNQDNYPVLIHCFHGVGRAEMYSAIYRIEYEGMDIDQAREKTRFLTKWSSFDIGKPKGDFLHNYKKRDKKNNITK